MWRDIFLFHNSFFLLMDHFTVTKCFTSMNVYVTIRVEHLWFSAADDVVIHYMFGLPLFHFLVFVSEYSIIIG
jgi:hypothetical protein